MFKAIYIFFYFTEIQVLIRYSTLHNQVPLKNYFYKYYDGDSVDIYKMSYIPDLRYVVSALLLNKQTL